MVSKSGDVGTKATAVQLSMHGLTTQARAQMEAKLASHGVLLTLARHP